MTRLLVWKRLRAYTRIQAKNTHLLRLLSNINHQYIKNTIKDSFYKIYRQSSTKNSNYSSKFVQMRNSIVERTLRRVGKKWIGLAFTKINRYSEYRKVKNIRIEALSILNKNLEEKSKLRAWIRLSSMQYG